MNTNNKKSIGNAGHREHMKNRFKEKMSLEIFSDKEILEMLLFYVIPRKDTSAAAENLLKKYGTLEKVLSAEKNQLKQIEGISENCAVSLKFFDSLIKKTAEEKNSFDFDTKLDVRNFPKMQGFVINLFDSEKDRSMLKILSVNENLTIKNQKNLCETDKGNFDFLGKECAKAVLKSNCELAILAHNHPHSTRKPTEKDIILTRKIMVFLKKLDITLLDHYIVGRDGAVSMRQMGLIYDLEEC